MKRLTLILALVPLFAFGQRYRDGRSWRIEDSEKSQRSFSLSGGEAPRLLVDNINGYVHVTGYSGSTVQVAVNKRLYAVNDSAMVEAKRDVKLDMNQQGNFVRLYVDGPPRTPNGTNYRGDDYYGYRVSFVYDIQVPAGTELVLKTVSDGNIEVKKTTGNFEVSGVNGGIDMQEVAGAGTVRTVNGPVKVGFTRNPAKECEFRSVNGTIDVYFQPNLSADLTFKTVNGGIYTDFATSGLPLQPAQAERRDGKFLYRSHGFTGVRIGSGGPELSFETLNGEVLIKNREK